MSQHFYAKGRQVAEAVGHAFLGAIHPDTMTPEERQADIQARYRESIRASLERAVDGRDRAADWLLWNQAVVRYYRHILEHGDPPAEGFPEWWRD